MDYGIFARGEKVDRKNRLLVKGFILAFFISSAFALYGKLLEPDKELSGVTHEMEVVERNLSSVMDGTYQLYLEDIWSEKFPGRSILIRIRNQVLYSVFNTSSNTNVVMGKNKYLIEPAYITSELETNGQPSAEDLSDTINDISTLKEILKSNGKELYVFISPSKAHFCEEKIPNLYKSILDNRVEGKEAYLERFCKALEEAGITYVNATDYIEKNRTLYKAPVFYASGVHWARVWGYSSAIKLLDEINEQSKYDIGKLEVSEYISDDPVPPDTDLYDSLNILKPASDTWYEANIKLINEGKDKPNVLFRGGSFMGQSLAGLANAGVFNKVVHLENSYCFTNNYSDVKYMSDYLAYDELPLDSLIGQSDIIILESNSTALSNFSFGFMEYMLSHIDYLDNSY